MAFQGKTELKAAAAATGALSRPRLRLLVVAATAAVVVTGVHRIVGAAPPAAWLAFHAAVPAAVFSLGVRSAGAGRLGPRTVLRGALVVAVVAAGFGWINGHPLPAPAAATFNFLVPLAVSTAGSKSARPFTRTINEPTEESP